MTKLKTALLVLAMAMLVFTQAQGQANEENNEGIQFFQAKWDDVLKHAKKEKKIIFVDCYTTWCGPCKMLSKNVFPQKEVGDYFNANFVSVKIDCEKGEGITLKDKFGVSAFPTLLFIDPKTEEVLHRVIGYVPAEKLIAEAKSAPAQSEKGNALAKAYKKNQKDIKTTEDYLSYLVKISDPKAEEVALHYLSLIPKTDWHKEDYFWIMSRYVKDPFSDEAAYYFKNKDIFVEANGLKGEYFESGMYYGYAGKLADVSQKEDFDQTKYDKFLQLMQSNGFDRIESIEDYTNRALLINVGDYAGYMDVVEEKFAEGLAKNPRYYSETGFNLLNRLKDCEDKDIFKRAVKLMDDAIQSQMENPELNMFNLSIAYRDAYDFVQKAGIEGERLAVAKAMNDLFVNIVPKHNALLDKTHKEAQKDKEEGKTGGRSVPAMKMGGF